MTRENETADKNQDLAKAKSREEAWLRLRGAFKDIYAAYGGGEAYLRQERESFEKPNDTE